MMGARPLPSYRERLPSVIARARPDETMDCYEANHKSYRAKKDRFAHDIVDPRGVGIGRRRLSAPFWKIYLRFRRPTEEHRQLGDIGSDAPCLVLGEHSSDVRIAGRFTRIDIGDRLPLSIDHFESARYRDDGPWRGETALGQ
jgi:hypothetical protein